MKQYTSNRIKNIVLLGHSGSGKTSLAEAMLFNAGVINRIGSIAEGNTVSDFDPEEIKRQISVRTSILTFEYMDYKVNLIDVPGFSDFIGESISGITSADCAVFTVCAVNGLGVGSQEMWKIASEYNLPRIIFINRMDKERADYFAVLELLRETFGKDVIPVHIPIGKENDFSGIIDVLKKKAYKFENNRMIEIPIPDNQKEDMEKCRNMLMEEVVEIDENLLAKFMNNEEITDEEVENAFQKSVDHNQIYPVLCGSATKNIGVSTLEYAMEHWLPSADEKVLRGIDGQERKSVENEPFSGYVFMTTVEPHVGELSFVRIFSGKLNHSSNVLNSSRNSTERVGQIFLMRGKNREEIQTAIAGDIVALPKLKSTSTGDTLCEPNKPIVYPKAKYPEPVYSISVKPKSKADQEKMGIALNALMHEDPTFFVLHNVETKETIISGMGDSS